MRPTTAGKTSMPVLLLNARAAPEGAALWLQMIAEQDSPHKPGSHSCRFHGRLTSTQSARTGSSIEYAGIEETMSPIAMETVADWILKVSAR